MTASSAAPQWSCLLCQDSLQDSQEAGGLGQGQVSVGFRERGSGRSCGAEELLTAGLSQGDPLQGAVLGLCQSSWGVWV